MKKYDLIVIGSGAAGMMASIVAGEQGKSVLLIEKLSSLGPKLKATGGGRCNLTNTLSNEDFMKSFGRDGQFMRDALNEFDSNDLVEFFKQLGVETHAPDGFHIFPITHNSTTIIEALKNRLEALNIDILLSQKVTQIVVEDLKVKSVKTIDNEYFSENVIVATGGLGYPMLGTEGDGFVIAKALGHKVSELYPAMIPLHTKEIWVAECRADTIPKVTIKIDLPKYNKLQASGDLIFTKKGIRGPVVLDFAREITPLLEKYGEVPILINMTRLNEEELRTHFKNFHESSVIETLVKLLPESLSHELCKLFDIAPDIRFKSIAGQIRERFIKALAWTPLTVVGHDGFDKAMVTRGGVSLKEINPKTMESKLIKGLYFCGEVMNLDGPCGGYNLQWSFASGYLAGELR